MNLLVKCPKCGRQLQVPDSSTGQVILCPGCDQFLKVPDQADAQHTQDNLPESVSGQLELPIWRNPATYVALGTVAALGIVLLVVFLDKPQVYMTARFEHPPQDPSPQVQSKSEADKPTVARHRPESGAEKAQADTETESPGVPHAGHVTRLRSSGDIVPVAISEEALDRFTQLSIAKDYTGISLMTAGGLLWSVRSSILVFSLLR